jgi:hypothetical protein
MGLVRLLLVVAIAACATNDAIPTDYYVPAPRAAIVAGRYAQDHRNAPDWQKLVDYDYVSLSPRAQAAGGPVGGTPAAEGLIAAGVKTLFVAFPCYFHYDNQPLPVGDVERDIEDLATKYSANLLRADGTPQFAYDCFVLDFRNREFVDALVDFWMTRAKIANGLLLHEACGGPPTEDPQDPLYYPQPSPTEQDWEKGFHYYVSELRRKRPDWDVIAVCDRWESNSPNGTWRPSLYDGLFFENLPSTLNPVGPKVFDELATGTRNVVGFYDIASFAAYPQFRRGAAAMAIARDALMLYGEEATITKDPEHFEIYYGTFPGPAKEIAPGVWERVGTHGLVVFNESGQDYDYVDPILGQHFSLTSPDGLSAQFRDRSSGDDLPTWITNVGR